MGLMTPRQLNSREMLYVHLINSKKWKKKNNIIKKMTNIVEIKKMTNILDIKKTIKNIVAKMKKTTNIHQKTKKISKAKTVIFHLNITKKIDKAEKTNIHQEIKMIGQGQVKIVVVDHQEIDGTA